jgi:hypothetical protein
MTSEAPLTLQDLPGFTANHARISVALSQFTVPLFSRTYQAFHGDMVAAIVLGEIAHRNVLAWLSKPENTEAHLSDAELRTQVMRPCNALSIAEACNLPRETVRRKVVALIDRGYIYRSDDGYLYLTPGVGNDFKDMTADTISALLATARQLEALLADAGPPGGP